MTVYVEKMNGNTEQYRNLRMAYGQSTLFQSKMSAESIVLGSVSSQGPFYSQLQKLPEILQSIAKDNYVKLASLAHLVQFDDFLLVEKEKFALSMNDLRLLSFMRAQKPVEVIKSSGIGVIEECGDD